MTQEEFKKEKHNLLSTYQFQVKKLAVDYALSNSPVKIGDVVTDHYHTIKVEEIKATEITTDHPSCVYSGVMLTAKGEPAKRQTDTVLYQVNLRKINGKEIC